MPSTILPAADRCTSPAAAADAISTGNAYTTPSSNSIRTSKDADEACLLSTTDNDPWRPSSASLRTRNRRASSPGASPSHNRLRNGLGLAKGATRHHHLHNHHHRPYDSPPRADSVDGRRSFSTGRYTYRSTRSRAASQSACAPQLTREEFEALPVAIRRKYFSTLERLRFAQESGQVDGIYEHYDAITARNLHRCKHLQDHCVPSPDNFTGRIRQRSLAKSPSFTSADDFLFYANLPEKIKKRHFSSEEQQFLSAQLARPNVILDAADEAWYKIGRRASTRLTSADAAIMEALHATQQPMGGMPVKRTGSEVPQSFYDSFRWLDEEEDLDLRLYLDDYHNNLREFIPSPSKDRHPSFRRHMSISKIPFSRPSVSSGARPYTKDGGPPSPTSSVFDTTPFPTMGSVSPSSSTAAAAPFTHTRKKSRTLSLITAKQTPGPETVAIDPTATHYQDPEARLKLRVYLASPQKFDEAIEFGFPSMDPSCGSSLASRKRGDTRQTVSDGSDTMQTFLDDDDEKMESDTTSIPDPESPRTPNLADSVCSSLKQHSLRSTTDTLVSHRPLDNYAQVPVSSREMTLRMTLTRPDLRACEDQIYGWKNQHHHQLFSGKPASLPKEDALGLGSNLATTPVAYVGTGGRPKENMENIFGAIDHWETDAPDKGVMKRFWNKVRRS